MKDAADLESYLNDFGLSEHREFLLGIARPSVEILNHERSGEQGVQQVRRLSGPTYRF